MDAVAAAVLYERHLAASAGSHGITLYAPSKANQKTDHAYYKTLDLALATGWDEFLDVWAP
jgi:hypothetical protein